jgi:hypothetical protein
MAKSLGDVLWAVPDDCDVPDATDADDWTTGAVDNEVGGSGGRVVFVVGTCVSAITAPSLVFELATLLPIPNKVSILENIALLICAKFMTSSGSA